MTNEGSETENAARRPNIEFAPGCFGSSIAFNKADAICSKCPFVEQCEPVQLQTANALKILQEPERYSAEEIEKAGIEETTLKFAKSLNAIAKQKKLKRNNKDCVTYAKEQKQAGRTVRAYNDRSDMTPDDLKALKAAENRKNVKAHRDRKKAEKAAAKAAKEAPS